jgi:integrase
VFTDQRGGVLRNSNYRARVFEPAAVSAGANVKALQRMSGHAKASMTLGVYADLFDENLDAVASSLTRRSNLLRHAPVS